MAGTREELQALLDEMLERPGDRGEIQQRIEERFVEQRAVVAIDMSGFSRTTQAHGVVSGLLMIHQMQRLAEMPVGDNGGAIVKADADNLFAVFDDVPNAVAASREITRSLTAANFVLPRELQLYVAIGIGYGPILMVGTEDMWGAEVNLASKLGEDVAQLGDILLTPGAYERLGGNGVEIDERKVQISGLELTYYAVRV